MKLKTIDINNIDDFRFGNSDNRAKGTGVTAIICEEGAVGGVDVRGGAPATRDTDLLRSENSVQQVNAIVLSGGSAFGLEAASGVARELSNRGVGFEFCGNTIPIVCGASLFDLEVGDSKAFPDVEMGIEATHNAFRGAFKSGNQGAGTGATVGKASGIKRAMKSGLGTFACADSTLQVGAVVAVNAFGDIYNGAGNIIAGTRSKEGDSIYGTIKTLQEKVHVEKEDVDDSEPCRKAPVPQDPAKNDHRVKMAQAVKSISDGFRKSKNIDKEEIRKTLMMSVAEAESKAADRQEPKPAVKPETKPVTKPEQAAKPSLEDDYMKIDDSTMHGGKRSESIREFFESLESEVSQKPERSGEAEIVDNSEELGYDIPFNTTIGCLVTNAKLTKPQANKLASILHDAYARAIKPVHSSVDGDTIFVLASGKVDVNFDAFAALATDIMQYAIINAATSSKSAYGLPAAADM